MCLAVPGRLVSVEGEDGIFRHGKVDFGGVKKDINLAYTPEAKPGDYVLVHVGFALSVVDEEEAGRIFEALRRLDEVADSAPGEEEPQP